MSLLLGGLLFLGGLALGLTLARRRTGGAVARAAGEPGGLLPHLVTDPALGWLRQAHGALAVWLLDRREASGPGRALYLSVAVEGLPDGEEDAIEARLSQLDGEAPSGVERRGPGLLVYAVGPAVAAMLLPHGRSAAAITVAQGDLAALVEGLGHRGVLKQLAKADEGAIESVESIGLRLAYEIERVVEADVTVALVRGSVVEVVGVSGRGDRRLLGRNLPAGCPLERVALGNSDELHTDDDPAGELLADRRRPGRSHVLPLATEGGVVGSVALAHLAGGATAPRALAEVRQSLANAARRFQSAQQVGRHRDEALVDPLTGLPNRRGFEARLHRVEHRHGAYIAADVDRFKVLNDTLGHPAGDAALVHVGRIIKEQIRGRDTAGRVGGEEFAVWLPQTTLEEALTVAERIRSALGTSHWSWQGRRWPLGASFGVAAMPETTRSKENLPGQADHALYQAKEQGRDRVVAAPRHR